MWKPEIQNLEKGRFQRYQIKDGSSTLTFSEVIQLWISSKEFRDFYTGVLRNSAFSSFRWEMPPVTHDGKDRQYEFILNDCPSLDRASNAAPFENYFQGARNENGVVSFPSLKKDARLVVPCPLADQSVYAHFASFLRKAPDLQIHSIWKVIGEQMLEQLNDEPIWLSTAGMGVAWLHVRLDSRPKYYSYRPYADCV